MKMNETLYQNTESNRKQPTMPFWTYEWLKRGDDEVMSKGVKAYEALLFANDEYEDSANDLEEFVDDRLTTLASPSLLTAVQKIKFEKAVGNVEEFASDYADFDSDERADHVNIHLPTTLTEQLTVQRGLGDHIADAVYDLVESAYSDRMDRIQCKKELVEFLEDERRTLSHDVAQAVVEGDSDKYRVDEAHRELNLVRSDDWHESDSVTISILEDRGEDITEGVSNRSQALDTALKNSDRDWDREEAIEKAKEVFGVHESTAEEYVDTIQISSMTDDVVEVDTTKIVDHIANTGWDWTDHDESQDMYEYVGLNEDDMIEGEFTTDEAHELVDDLSAKTMKADAYDDTRQNAQESLHTLVVALRKVLDDGYDDEKRSHRVLKSIGAVDI
ncbi:hypothetical protein [Halobacterium noricense]|uniref:hypothetical protein n=1 Tax=Halobacterium noricense TaxID=223182 RepID=UPI001E5B7622|nr:hypothetical protein [Halobacterium noricense]UHH25592.1 hypothetical protein LT974_01295 [Halobacterium noricense]